MKKLALNAYPGRGIIVGKSTGGTGVLAYFATGRSVNSRNRIITAEGSGARTQAFDPTLTADPTLVIYNAVKTFDRFTIVTNGDHTDTVYRYLSKGYSFQRALNSREFEPDSPIYTPRIAALVEHKGDDFAFDMAVLHPDSAIPPRCVRGYYRYETMKNGEGALVHTYLADGNPPPAYNLPPRPFEICGDIEEFSEKLWGALNKSNKIFLFVRYIDVDGKGYVNKIINAL